MMKEKQNKQSSVFMNAIIFTIAASFVIGSVNRVSFKKSDPTVITIGDYEITESAFRRELYQQIMLMESNKGQAKTHKEMMYRVSKAVNNIITHKALEIEMNRIGIKVSNKYAMDSIKKRKEFCDEYGKFAPEKLNKVLDSMRMREKEFIEIEKIRIARQKMEYAFKIQIASSKVLIDNVLNGYFQKRYGIYKYIKFDTTSITVEPKENELLELYNGLKHKPQSKEMRKCSFIRLSPTVFINNIKVSEKEIEEEYKVSAMIEPINEVREKLISTIKQKKATEKLARLTAQIEEELGAGKTLEQIAKTLKLEISNIETDHNGKNIHGHDIISFHDLGSNNDSVKSFLLAKIFSFNIGDSPEFIKSETGEAFFIVVDKGIPSKTLDFQESHTALVKLWKQKKQEEMIKAQVLEEQKKLPTDISTWRKINGVYTVELSIAEASEAIPKPVVDAMLLSLSLGKSIIVTDKHGVYLVGMYKIDNTTVDEEKKKNLQDAINYYVQDAFWNSFTDTIAKKYPRTETNQLKKILEEIFKNDK